VIGKLLFVPASVRATAHESIGTSLQAAARLGVGYSTLKHWIYEGRVRTRVTSGGHHRIADAEVVERAADCTPGSAATRSTT